MKVLEQKFLDDLKNDDGLLNPILKRVKQDHTLLLAIRENYINIYYRGGSILKVEKSGYGYTASFDEEYNKNAESALDLPPRSVGNQDVARKWVDKFQSLKLVMDFFFSKHGKAEREFQQLVVRENNYSSISNESEYFIADIECSDSDINARYDMLAIQWLANRRKNGSNCKAALIEMKYGDGSLDGTSGIMKHIQDMAALIKDKERYGELLNAMETKFDQLVQLDLLHCNSSAKGTKVKLDVDDKPEVIFILANHNPRSTKLKTLLLDHDFQISEMSGCFDLKFFVSTFAGYGLHSKCLLGLDEIKSQLSALDRRG
jgi:hypothetical protein